MNTTNRPHFELNTFNGAIAICLYNTIINVGNDTWRSVALLDKGAIMELAKLCMIMNDRWTSGKILNLTQHPATPDQIAAKVVDTLALDIRKQYLTFVTLPSARELDSRAELLADYCQTLGFSAAMIGGAGYLMSKLESALRARGITPMHAFSQRVSIESRDPETGEVTKINSFSHAGWVVTE